MISTRLFSRFPDGRHVGGIGLRAALEGGGARNEGVRTGGGHEGSGLRRHAAVDLDIDVAVADHRLHAPNLVADGGDEGLAAETGVHRHQEHQIHHVEHRLDGGFMGARVENHAGLLAQCSDGLERPMQVRACFRMDADDVCACLGEGLEVGIDRGDHQMHVEHLPGVGAQGFDHVWTDGDVRHEMAVHHVDVDPVGAGGVDGADLLAELGEVRGENGGGDEERACHERAGSTGLPWRQRSFAPRRKPEATWLGRGAFRV